MKGLITDIGQIKDTLSGLRYGRLVVKELIGHVLEKKKVHGNPSFGKKAVYSCICDCGNEHLVRAKDLKRGMIQSCGCLHKESSSINGKANKLKEGNSALNALYSSYLYNASKRELEFTLTKEQFRELTSKNCSYCNVAPYKDAKTQHTEISSSYKWNGLDRSNPSKGYTLNNVVPCCEQCNYAKLDYTQEEFLNWIKRVYEYQNTLQDNLDIKLITNDKT